MVLLLCACTSTGRADYEAADTPAPQVEDVSAVEEHCSDNLLAVLRGEKEICYHSYRAEEDASGISYINTGESAGCFIDTLAEMAVDTAAFPDWQVPVMEYAEVDLDGDNKLELVLHVDNLPGACSYGYVILRDMGESVNGYLFYQNGVYGFKQDGTFFLRAGGSYLAVAVMSFSENGYEVNALADYDYANSAHGEMPYCTIDGAEVTYQEIEEYMERHNEKEEVIWTAVEEDNFEAVLNGTEKICERCSNEKYAINEIILMVGGAIEPRYCEATKYTISDIDGDGEEELVLWVKSAEEELYCTVIVEHSTESEEYCATTYMGDAMFRQIENGSLSADKDSLVWIDYSAPNASEFGFDRCRNDGSFEYEILGDEKLTIRRYIGSDAEVIIPAEIGGLKVSSISYYTVDHQSIGAFQSCDCVKSVTIPDGIELIYDDAFRDCANLEAVSIPASVRGIGNCAFSNCGQLTAVYFEGGAPSFGNYVFESCPSVTIYYHAEADGWNEAMQGAVKAQY